MSRTAGSDSSFGDALAQAAHHRGAMVERRTIGLKIVVGVVSFDLVVIKLAIDSASHVADHGQLAWIVRLIAGGAFVALLGMLAQLEIRNRQDRHIYRTAELRAKAIQDGNGRSTARGYTDTAGKAIRDAWATTWPLLGVLVLTVAMWWMAGLLS